MNIPSHQAKTGGVTRRDLIDGIAGGMLLASLPGVSLARTSGSPSMGQGSSYSYIDIPNAEDLAPIKGTRWLLTSGTTRRATPPVYDLSQAKREFRPGGIYVIDRTDRSYQRVWPDKGQTVRRDLNFTDCDAPVSATAFSCSGLHIAQGKAGIHRLYVVHTGERQSIEIFEVREGNRIPSLTWVGALLVPYPGRPNSVAVQADGSLFVSCFERLDDPDAFQKFKTGKDTGYLLRWHPTTGWEKLDGSDGSGPNGILVSADRATLYCAVAGSQKLVAYSLDGEMGSRTVALEFTPDNLRWDDRGMIWIGGVENLETFAPRVCKIDPRTLTPKYIDLPAPSDKYLYCSVAVQIDQEIWLGSFNSARMAVLPATE